MNKVIEKTIELKEEILSRTEVKEYLRLKEILKNNEELQGLRQEIARLTDENKLEERDNLLTVYNAHPLIVNYTLAKEEVAALLNTIKDIIK